MLHLHGMMKFSAIFAFKQRFQLGCGVQYKHLCFAFMDASVVVDFFLPSQHRSTPNYFHFEEYFTHSLPFCATSLGGMACSSVAFLCVCVLCTSTQKSFITFVKAQTVRTICVCVCVCLKSIAWSGITTAAMLIHSLNAKQIERCRKKCTQQWKLTKKKKNRICTREKKRHQHKGR